MTTDPLISVIVPVHNAARYLRRCVDSILGQTYDNIELILIDDGSKDGSPAICDAYQDADSRVIVKHSPNGGVSSARNKGLSLATGSYVSFVDSDDYLTTDAYEKLIGKAEEQNADIVYSDYSLVYEDGHLDYCHSSAIGATLQATIANRLLQEKYPGTIWNFLLIRRDLIVRNGLLFEDTFKFGEDFIFCIKSYLAAEAIEKVEEPLYYYYLGNNQSATYSKPDIVPEQDIKWLQEIYDAFRKNGRVDEFKNELYYRTLNTKTNWVISPRRFDYYYNFFPEANPYSESCPLIGKKMKMVMRLLNQNKKFAASLLVIAYMIKERIHA